MNNFAVLAIGEIQRMKKYNILGASLFVAILWVGMLYFIDTPSIGSMFPLLLFIDATSMPMLLIGATMFFEKQEGVTKTLLVSPITKGEYILSKTFANILSSITSLIIMYAYVKIFKEIDINFLGLLGAIVLISFFHSLIGFILTYYSKDFNSLLMGMMKYAFVVMIPVLLEEIGIIKIDILSKILYILPTKASMILLNASSSGIESWEIYFSLGYMIVASALLYLVVSKKFNEFAIKESGV